MIKNEYYYISDIRGTLKGILGEILFQNYKKNVFSTKFCNSDVLNKLPFKIPTDILVFMKNNWNTIDCFEFRITKSIGKYIFLKAIFYEIKTKNYHDKTGPKLYDRLKFTSHQLEVYRNAQKIGIEVKIVKILLFEKGKYLINLLDFDTQKYNYLVCNGTKSFQKAF